MPVKQLPNRPSLEHLKNQARDLLKAHAAKDPEALQRLREFVPKFGNMDDSEIAERSFHLSDAYFAIAREYGYTSWTRLKSAVESGKTPRADIPLHERIEDPLFRSAVDLLDAGEAEALTKLLTQNPDLVYRHVHFDNMNYFNDPTLLEFIAENPVRHESMPQNVVEIARVILEAGAKRNQSAMNMTIALLASGRVSREQGHQKELIDLLCDYGGSPDALGTALAHSEFDAADALVKRGAKINLPEAAALGRREEAKRLLANASVSDRHLALAFAAQHGRNDILEMLLHAGEDPSRYNPPGAHSHSTPLHQAVVHGRKETVRLLVERGARLDLKDTIYQGTPLDWAEYAGESAIADLLRAAAATREVRRSPESRS
jgi:hypothetical protein